MASGQETGGGYSLPTNGLQRITAHGEWLGEGHLKVAHWKPRGLWHATLFGASEKEANKQMLRNYHNTTKDKYF